MPLTYYDALNKTRNKLKHHPLRASILLASKKLQEARDAFKIANDKAYAKFKKRIAPAWAAYQRKKTASAWTAFKKAQAPHRAAYLATMRPSKKAELEASRAHRNLVDAFLSLGLSESDEPSRRKQPRKK